MLTQADRAAEQRRVKLEEIQRQVKDGSLKIRKMTRAERKRFPPSPRASAASSSGEDGRLRLRRSCRHAGCRVGVGRVEGLAAQQRLREALELLAMRLQQAVTC